MNSGVTALVEEDEVLHQRVFRALVGVESSQEALHARRQVRDPGLATGELEELVERRRQFSMVLLESPDAIEHPRLVRHEASEELLCLFCSEMNQQQIFELLDESAWLRIGRRPFLYRDVGCCAVAGECQTTFPQVCAPFESTGKSYCFLSCEASDIEAHESTLFSDGGAIDANLFCRERANPSFGCRSTGGGKDNRKVCTP